MEGKGREGEEREGKKSVKSQGKVLSVWDPREKKSAIASHARCTSSYQTPIPTRFLILNRTLPQL